MLRSILDNSIYFIKKGIVVIQPPLGISQFFIDFVCRNQADHQTTSFGDEYVLSLFGIQKLANDHVRLILVVRLEVKYATMSFLSHAENLRK